MDVAVILSSPAVAGREESRIYWIRPGFFPEFIPSTSSPLLRAGQAGQALSTPKAQDDSK
jgi:hypothetical protein